MASGPSSLALDSGGGATRTSATKSSPPRTVRVALRTILPIRRYFATSSTAPFTTRHFCCDDAKVSVPCASQLFSIGSW